MQRVMPTIERNKLLGTVRFLRRFSPAWVLAVVVVSFLLANALSLYTSQAFLPVGGKTRPSRVAVGGEMVSGGQRGLSKRDQEIIVARNIFNSDGKVGDSVDGPAKPKDADKILRSDLPLRLVGVIFSGDPYNGLAMIENTQNKKTNSYMIGDKLVENAVLDQIWDDRVILERAGGREFLEMGRFELKGGRTKGGSKPSGGGGPLPLGKIATRGPAAEFKEDGFERKGASITLTEEYKRNLLSADNLTKVLQDAKAEPNMVGGTLQGFRLTRIRENSAYEKAGFQNGDIIEEINGIPLRDAGGAIRLLNQLKNEKDIEVRLNRNGQVSNMQIKVQ